MGIADASDELAVILVRWGGYGYGSCWDGNKKSYLASFLSLCRFRSALVL